MKKINSNENEPGFEEYVVKVRNDLGFENFRKALQEVFIATNPHNPEILSYEDFRIERDREKPEIFQLYIKTARMKMPLSQFLNNRLTSNQGPFPKPVVLEYIKTLLVGLLFLSEKKIAHRNIKPANIFLNFNDKLVIADLDKAKSSLDDTAGSAASLRETYIFMAPELLSSQQRKQMKKKDLLKADVWSMGLTILEICLLGQSRTKKFALVDRKQAAAIMREDLNDVIKEYGADLASLISSMLHHDPAQRKSIEDIYQAFEQKFCHQVEIYFNRFVLLINLKSSVSIFL